MIGTSKANKGDKLVAYVFEVGLNSRKDLFIEQTFLSSLNIVSKRLDDDCSTQRIYCFSCL